MGRWLLITLFLSLASVVQTWPLVLHLSDKIMDWPEAGDSWPSLWNLWWVKHAIVEQHTNPLHTDHLYFPQGSDLYLHTLTLVNAVLAIPLEILTGNVFLSWNLLAITFIVVSGVAMYAVALRVTSSHISSLVSAYIFAFAPYVLMRLQVTHWHLSTTWFLPVLILFLLRLEDTGRLREAAAAGIAWSLITYNSLEYATQAGLFLGLFVSYWSVRYLAKADGQRLRALWRGFAVTVAVWLLASSPLLIPAALDIYSDDYALPGTAEYWSANLRAFVTPSPLWASGKDPLTAPLDVPHAGTVENTLYLGIVPLILAAVAVLATLRSNRQTILWTIVFLFFATLALGPHLYIDEAKTYSLLGYSFSVPLPYQIYDRLPLVGAGRVPERMIMFAIVGLSLLAGIGVNQLASWLHRYHKVLSLLPGLIVLALVVLEYWNPPVQLSQLTEPAVIKEIGREPGDFSVLHAPWGRFVGWGATGDFAGAPLTSYYQTIHGKPSFGGYLSRAKQTTLDWVGVEPGLHYLACPACNDKPEDMNPDLVRQAFLRYRVKYIIVHKLNPNGQPMPYSEETLAQIDQYLRVTAGMTRTYADLGLIVYRNEDIP